VRGKNPEGRQALIDHLESEGFGVGHSRTRRDGRAVRVYLYTTDGPAGATELRWDPSCPGVVDGYRNEPAPGRSITVTRDVWVGRRPLPSAVVAALTGDA
jgi:DNA-binding PadR family transcriptional regulator